VTVIETDPPGYQQWVLWRTCERKAKYVDRASAKKTAKLVRRFSGGSPVKAYHCEFCGYWHIGKGSPRPRRQDAES
jgi:hypothetical protein